MSTELPSNKTKLCPFCAEEIQDAAIKCKHCGEFLTQTNNSYKEDTVAEQSDEKKSILGKVILLLGAVILHVLFCAESPLLFISKTNPILSLVGSLSYSLPGMLISIILLAPIMNLITKENKGSGFLRIFFFTLKSITIALYIGAAIRLVLFVANQHL